MKKLKLLKDKLNGIVLRVYVKWTILLWQVEDSVKDMTDDLKKYTKMSK